ncbi:MAG: hypothetical protein JSV62_02810 [Promethearchaeota archaeon]|nr:MAG: hypothetical protein JSV62_02810 [Candidatus Lokiarchaeota archaeon]
MAKKKKETCPYCGKSFAYLSRHKCKIKERVEGPLDEKSDVERRIERIEEKKKEFNRTLRKDEKLVLNIINREKDIFFNRLMELSNKKRNDLEEILELLELQSKIKMKRELVDASWTKHVYAIEEIEVKAKDLKINKSRKEFIWNMFSNQPCFICPFRNKCNETNLDQFNPHHCPWLTEWIETASKGEDYNINFDEIEARLQDV